jgi:NitT/TauT family transport system substrate-binding protein
MFHLLGCSKSDQIKIMAPQGSPELAVTYLKSHVDYHVDVVIGADPLLAAFSSQTHDVIIAPTHLGAKLYASNFDYIMLGVVVFGNYYFASQSQQLNDLTDINGKEVVIFGQNQTSDIIVKHLFNHFEVEANITYVDSVATANAMLILNPELIILTAEPSLSTLIRSYPNLEILSLDSYYQRLEGQTYPQASVFVKTSLSDTTMKKIE